MPVFSMFFRMSYCIIKSKRLCYNTIYMNAQDIISLAALLRDRLEPLEHAALLADTLAKEDMRARKAAVLLALFEQEGQIFLPFIRRSSQLRLHSGQIAFPGGGADPGDRSLIETALREAREEIGLDSSGVRTLGVLPPMLTVVSNFLVVPVVAWLPHGLGQVQLQPGEVDEQFSLPLAGLADPANFHSEIWTRDGRSRTIYFYDVAGYRVWGVTAYIMRSFLELFRE